MNRKIADTYATHRHTYAYDAVGNRVLLLDPTGTYTSTYTRRNALATHTVPGAFRTTYSYLNTSIRSTLIAPDGGIFTYLHDAARRLTALVNPQSETTTFIYDLVDRETRKHLANDSVTTHIYDLSGRLLRLLNARSDGTTISSFDYLYDCAKNRKRVVEADGSIVSWSYDRTYQLTREERTGTAPFATTFAYDLVGNRLLRIHNSDRTSYLYDKANELLWEDTSGDRTTYLYDLCGNRTEKEAPTQTTFYAYDEDHRLTVAEPPAGAVTLSYNAADARVRKETPADTRKFLYDFENLLRETDENDDLEKEYTGTAEQFGSLVSQFDGVDSSYHQFDGLGSTAELTNPAETSTDEYVYRAFGEVESKTGSTPNDYTFIAKPGYRLDPEIDLYFCRKRYYDPAIGQPTQEDPIGINAGDINFRRWVANNPVNRTDPSGLEAIGEGIDSVRFANRLYARAQSKLGVVVAPFEPVNPVDAGGEDAGGITATVKGKGGTLRWTSDFEAWVSACTLNSLLSFEDATPRVRTWTGLLLNPKPFEGKGGLFLVNPKSTFKPLIPIPGGRTVVGEKQLLSDLPRKIPRLQSCRPECNLPVDVSGINDRRQNIAELFENAEFSARKIRRTGDLRQLLGLSGVPNSKVGNGNISMTLEAFIHFILNLKEVDPESWLGAIKGLVGDDVWKLVTDPALAAKLFAGMKQGFSEFTEPEKLKNQAIQLLVNYFDVMLPMDALRDLASFFADPKSETAFRALSAIQKILKLESGDILAHAASQLPNARMVFFLFGALTKGIDFGEMVDGLLQSAKAAGDTFDELLQTCQDMPGLVAAALQDKDALLGVLKEHGPEFFAGAAATLLPGYGAYKFMKGIEENRDEFEKSVETAKDVLKQAANGLQDKVKTKTVEFLGLALKGMVNVFATVAGAKKLKDGLTTALANARKSILDLVTRIVKGVTKGVTSLFSRAFSGTRNASANIHHISPTKSANGLQAGVRKRNPIDIVIVFVKAPGARPQIVPVSELKGKNCRTTVTSEFTEAVVLLLDRSKLPAKGNPKTAADNAKKLAAAGAFVNQTLASAQNAADGCFEQIKETSGAEADLSPCKGERRGWTNVRPHTAIFLKNTNEPKNPRTRKLVIVGSVVANLEKKDGNKSRATRDWLTKPVYMAIDGDPKILKEIMIGYADDTVGHIIPYQFGGLISIPEGWDPGNVFPQSDRSQDDYKNWVDKALLPNVGKKDDVCIEIEFMFGDDQRPYRPDEFLIRWWLGEKEQTPSPPPFKNHKP